MAIGAANVALRQLVCQPPCCTTIANQARNVASLPLTVVELQNEHIDFTAVDEIALFEPLPGQPGVSHVRRLTRILHVDRRRFHP
jgi:hypothetical protein